MPNRSGGGAGRHAALGFRVHSGWATLVAVAGPPRAPAVALRRRVELSRRTPRQPYHAAAGMGVADARALVERSRAEALRLAGAAVGDAQRELHQAGWALAAAGMLLAGGRALPELEAVLASHPLIHTAEGALFRGALLEAVAAAGLRATALPERELEGRAREVLGRPAEELSAALATWGRAIGPPWRREEKLACLVAWTALGS